MQCRDRELWGRVMHEVDGAGENASGALVARYARANTFGDRTVESSPAVTCAGCHPWRGRVPNE